jgi:hypothetical protein
VWVFHVDNGTVKAADRVDGVTADTKKQGTVHAIEKESAPAKRISSSVVVSRDRCK